MTKRAPIHIHTNNIEQRTQIMKTLNTVAICVGLANMPSLIRWMGEQDPKALSNALITLRINELKGRK